MNPYRFENQNREIVLSRYNMPTPLDELPIQRDTSRDDLAGGRRRCLVPFAADLAHQPLPLLPPADRPPADFISYIKDGDSVWCPTSEPCACKPEKWEAAHGMGYTRFTAERDGLRTEATYLVSR